MYEFLARDVAVMRRKSDGWVNATHILKAARFEKAQRTRILEKEIQKNEHEKIQGGYGRYQGTWVPVEVARQVAAQYHVLDILEPLLNYQESEDNPPPSVKHMSSVAKAKAALLSQPKKGATPRKSRGKGRKPAASKVASVDSANFTNDIDENLANTASRSSSTTTSIAPGDTPPPFSQPTIGQSDTNTLRRARSSASTPAEYPIPGAKRGRGRPKGTTNKPKAQRASTIAAELPPAVPNIQQNNQLPDYQLNTTKKRQRTHSDTPPDIPGAKKQKQVYNKPSTIDDTIDSRSLSSQSSSPSDFLSDNDDYLASRPSPAHDYRNRGHQEIIDTPSFASSSSFKNQPNDSLSGSPLMERTTPTSQSTNSNENDVIYGNELIAAQYGTKLLDYFMAPEGDDVPDALIHPPQGLDINHVIDDEGHTVFHWACSMGNPKIVQALIGAGANKTARNLRGQTPLMRSIMFTNNFELRTFSQIVNLLSDTVALKDNSQRTVLHHIADSTAYRTKRSAAKFYNEMILAKLSESAESKSALKNLINQQDVNGDTALHIAARNGARKCFKELISYDAATDIVNQLGKTPADYIREYESHRKQYSNSTGNGANGGKTQSSAPNSPQISDAPYPQDSNSAYTDTNGGNGQSLLKYPNNNNFGIKSEPYSGMASGNSSMNNNNISSLRTPPHGSKADSGSYSKPNQFVSSEPQVEQSFNNRINESSAYPKLSNNNSSNNTSKQLNASAIPTPPISGSYQQQAAANTSAMDVDIPDSPATIEDDDDNNSPEPKFVSDAMNYVNTSVANITKQLQTLAEFYKVQLEDKSNDVDQVRKVLKQAQKSITESKQEIKRLLANYKPDENNNNNRNEKGKGKPSSSSSSLVVSAIDKSEEDEDAEAEAYALKKIEEIEEIVQQKKRELKGIVERSQARDLAQLVKGEESLVEEEVKQEMMKLKAKGENNNTTKEEDGNFKDEENDTQQDEETQQDNSSNTVVPVIPPGMDEEKLELVIDLFLLQQERRKSVGNIIELWSTAGVQEKMNRYKKLISMSCEVPADEINEHLLAGIEQALSETG